MPDPNQTLTRALPHRKTELFFQQQFVMVLKSSDVRVMSFWMADTRNAFFHKSGRVIVMKINLEVGLLKHLE